MSWGNVQMISGEYCLDSKSELSYAKSEIKRNIRRYGNIEEYPDLGNDILPIISIETVCKSFEEAEELADSLDWKGKNSLLIPYKDVGDRDIWTIKVNTIYLNIYHEENNLEKYIKRSRGCRNHKSKFVGCPRCGSRLNRKSISNDKCPLCGQDISSSTVKKTIKRYKNNIKEMKKELREEKEKLAYKAKTKYLFLYEEDLKY
ncbi:hypothetical protein [Faecalibacillus intestinalis]|uniref:hypothetical protein n=1 Tax=Faecalibacillus intestinalis TaxID=1982626 RepID=UPI0039942470